MSAYGTRDGILTPRILQYGKKKLAIDYYISPMASSAVLSDGIDMTSTAANTLGTALDYPRAISFVNGLEAESERRLKVVIKGYTGFGEYTEETVTLSSAATGKTTSSNAFSYVTSIVPHVSTKGYGTYSTVHVKPSDKFGITEYCESASDQLDIQIFKGDSQARAISTTNQLTAIYNSTYNTMNLAGKNIAGSTLAIKYLSKGQKK